jgi:hypothetical protein
LRGIGSHAKVNPMKASSARTSARPTQVAAKSEYDRDFQAWITSQARALRERRFDALDLDNLIEEVEDLGKAIARELRSRLKILLVHLLKWQYQSAKRSSSWRLTLGEQRDQIEDLLEENPSLRPQLADAIAKAYASACKTVAREMKLAGHRAHATFPAQCPWSLAEILDDGFLPSPARPASR